MMTNTCAVILRAYFALYSRFFAQALWTLVCLFTLAAFGRARQNLSAQRSALIKLRSEVRRVLDLPGPPRRVSSKAPLTLLRTHKSAMAEVVDLCASSDDEESQESARFVESPKSDLRSPENVVVEGVAWREPPS